MTQEKGRRRRPKNRGEFEEKEESRSSLPSRETMIGLSRCWNNDDAVVDITTAALSRWRHDKWNEIAKCDIAGERRAYLAANKSDSRDFSDGTAINTRAAAIRFSIRIQPVNDVMGTCVRDTLNSKPYLRLKPDWPPHVSHFTYRALAASQGCCLETRPGLGTMISRAKGRGS